MPTFAAIISSGIRSDTNALVELLARAVGDRHFETRIVGSSEEATSAARVAARSANTVIAVGGDGTVSDVATGILGTGAALGIVPAGSTNITARSLGIPSSQRAAIAMLTRLNYRRRIDVGRSQGRCFLHIAGAGFDAEIFKSTNRTWKSRVGWLAYLPPAASAFRIAPSAVTLTADDASIDTYSPLVLVANGGSAIVPTFKLHPEITVDDGWLDLLVFTATTAPQIVATLGHLGSQRLDRSPHVIWKRAKNIVIDADPPLAVELDGDLRGWTPREFSIQPNALEVVAPPNRRQPVTTQPGARVVPDQPPR